MRIALQRAEVFAKDNANSCTLSITPALNPGEPALLTLSAKSPEQGKTEAMLDATAVGEKTAWSANYKYMLEAVESYRKDAERLVIHTNGPENPAVIRPEYYPEGDDEVNARNAGSITVIMPMSQVANHIQAPVARRAPPLRYPGATMPDGIVPAANSRHPRHRQIAQTSVKNGEIS